ncbi:MAG: hypothetical protein PUG15_05840, partial [Bacteroidales bacterium]|nr:hypothetical protein [Bacteroidales bacterium]
DDYLHEIGCLHKAACLFYGMAYPSGCCGTAFAVLPIAIPYGNILLAKCIPSGWAIGRYVIWAKRHSVGMHQY